MPANQQYPVVATKAVPSTSSKTASGENPVVAQEAKATLDKIAAEIQAINTKELNTANEISKLEKQSVRILNLYLISLGALAIVFIVILISLIIRSPRAPAVLN